MYSVFFSIFTKFSIAHLHSYLISEHFHHLVKKLSLLEDSTSLSPAPATNNDFCLYVFTYGICAMLLLQILNSLKDPGIIISLKTV